MVWSSPHSQQKSPKCSTRVQSQKRQNDLCTFPMQTIEYHCNPSLYPNQWCWRSWSWMVLWGLSRTNTQKRCPFHHRGLDAKVGSQEIPGVTGKFDVRVQNEAGQKLTVLPKEHTGRSKHPLLTTQETVLHMDITRWLTPKSGCLYSLQTKMEKLYNSHQKQDWELTMAQIMNSLLLNSDLNWRQGKPLDHSGMT